MGSIFQSSATDPPSSITLTCHLCVPKWARPWIFSSPQKAQQAVLHPWFLLQDLPKNHYCRLLLCRFVCACLHWPFFRKKTQRRGYSFSLHWTCAVSQPRSLQLAFFVRGFWLSCRDNYTAGHWEIPPSSWRLPNRRWLCSETPGPAVITQPLN